jgi:hypothetical protein
MAQASESTVSAILKEVYPGAIEDQLNNEVALWAMLEKQKVQLDGQGKRIVRPVRVQRNNGFGARNDTDALPSAGSQGLTQAQINMSSNYMVGQLTARVIRTSFGSDAAFMNALEEEIKFGLSDFANEVGRQAFTGAGVLTLVNGAVTASTSIVVSDVKYLAVGSLIEFWNGATNQTTNDSGVIGTAIVSINTTTNTIVVTTAQTIATGATVARAGNNTAATTSKELQGLDTIIDDTTDYGTNYFGINRSNANYYQLQGNRLDATTALTEDKMQQVVDNARSIGGGRIDAIFCDYKTRRQYLNLLTSNKRYPVDGIMAPSFAGGLKVSEDLRTQMGEGLSFDGAMVVPSRLAPSKKMFFLDTASFKVFQQSDIEWVMNGDSVLHPLLSTGYDAYRFALFYDAQIYSEAPNRSAKIVNTY